MGRGSEQTVRTYPGARHLGFPDVGSEWWWWRGICRLRPTSPRKNIRPLLMRGVVEPGLGTVGVRWCLLSALLPPGNIQSWSLHSCPAPPGTSGQSLRETLAVAGRFPHPHHQAGPVAPLPPVCLSCPCHSSLFLTLGLRPT